MAYSRPHADEEQYCTVCQKVTPHSTVEEKPYWGCQACRTPK